MITFVELILLDDDIVVIIWMNGNGIIWIITVTFPPEGVHTKLISARRKHRHGHVALTWTCRNNMDMQL
jgi:hypothetical protein